MKTIYSSNQPQALINADQNPNVLLYENNLHLKVWTRKDMQSGYYNFYAKSEYFKEDANVMLKRNELVIQACIEVEVKRPFRIKNFNSNTDFIFNSVYAIIKSSKIVLPESFDYNLVSFHILREGLLLIKIKQLDHNLKYRR